ncbi:amidohydrolase family protein [Sporosarcina sp. 179-K 3D1 HS]|uniref:amidohydrolase family protein n=1 Tax=Sporosarcina sp. 179-K 3D1 HS TaxID=3232169 RepID=UPI0039A00827
MRIDAHQHFWDFDRVPYVWPTQDEEPIFRSIEPPELEGILKEVQIDKTILVQADNSYEDTQYMLEIAERYNWVAGVVGWVPLDKPDETAIRLESFLENPYFKGVRHLIHYEKDVNWLIQPRVIEGLNVLQANNVPFDVVAVLPEHLKLIPILSEKLPNLRMVIDHLGKPPIASAQFEPWQELIKQAASNPNVYAKISGLNTAASADWVAEDLKPYIDIAFSLFGANRLMFGSDWPVLNLAGNYKGVLDSIETVMAERNTEEVKDVFENTATEFYQL